jgi:hypothetical protein
MTAPDPLAETMKKSLPRGGRPYMTFFVIDDVDADTVRAAILRDARASACSSEATLRMRYEIVETKEAATTTALILRSLVLKGPGVSKDGRRFEYDRSHR